MAETIKDFLVSLGWEFSQEKQRRFVDAMRTAELQAKLLADALEALARKAWDTISEVANSFDRLYFSVQRTGATAATIKDFGYAVSQLGGSADAAQASLEAMGQKLRENPGNIAYLNALGFGLNKINGHLEIQADKLAKFQRMPLAVAEQYRALAGMDERTFLALRDPALLQQMQAASEARKRFGFDPDQAAEDANRFMTTWRSVANDVGVIADELFTKLMKALDGPLREFKKFLDANGAAIREDIDLIAKAFGRMADGWVKSFEEILKDPDSLKGFQTTMHRLAEDIAWLADKFSLFIEGLKWIDAKGSAVADVLNKITGQSPAGSSFDMGGGGGGGGGVQHLLPDGAGGGAPYATPHAPAPAQRPSHLRRLWNWMTGSGGDSADAGGASGALPALAGSQPRNLRNNNPGNIIDGSFARSLPGYRGSDGTFAIFATMEDGYRAANRNLDSYARQGVVTPWDIVHKWAPFGDGANNPDAYAAKLQRMSGLDPYAPLGNDPTSRARMLAAMTGIEGSSTPYSAEQIASVLGGAAGSTAALNLKGAQATAGGGSHPGLIGVARMLQQAFPGMQFSALNDAYHAQGGGSGPNGAHGRGYAFDATNLDLKASKAYLRAKLGSLGFEENKDYWIEPGDGGGTGPHLHFQWNSSAAASRFNMSSGKERASPFANMPAWKGVGALGAMPGLLGGAAPLGGASTTGDKNVSVNQHNTFHIDGAGDPHAAAQMVGSNMDRTTQDISRSMIGATN